MAAWDTRIQCPCPQHPFHEGESTTLQNTEMLITVQHSSPDLHHMKSPELNVKCELRHDLALLHTYLLPCHSEGAGFHRSERQHALQVELECRPRNLIGHIKACSSFRYLWRSRIHGEHYDFESVSDPQRAQKIFSLGCLVFNLFLHN